MVINIIYIHISTFKLNHPKNSLKSGRIKNLCKKKGKLFYELKRGNYTEKDSKEIGKVI